VIRRLQKSTVACIRVLYEHKVGETCSVECRGSTASDVADHAMAVEEDAKALQVHDLVSKGELDELRSLLDEHQGVNVDGYEDEIARRALYWACSRGHTESCSELRRAVGA
jgi:hypothetical protein